MTFIHLANCIALTFVPSWIVYKSKLEDYATVSMGWQSLFIYVATQLLQMVLTATFVPSSKLNTFDATQEMMKAFITLADCLGLMYLFQQKRTVHAAAFVGLHWSMSESFMKRMTPLMFEAGSVQFSWKHTITSLEANISIVTHMCMALLVWMYLRRSQLRTSIVVVIVAQRFLVPMVTSYLGHAMPELPFMGVAAEAVMALVFALATRGFLSQLDQAR